MTNVMPKKSKLKLSPLNIGDETIGQRLARLRKERGYTQIELSNKTGLIQTLVSDYERGKLRLHAEMVIRFSKALDISADELLGINASKKNKDTSSLRLLRRIKKIDSLPPSQQKTLLKTIDIYLKGTER